MGSFGFVCIKGRDGTESIARMMEGIVYARWIQELFGDLFLCSLSQRNLFSEISN